MHDAELLGRIAGTPAITELLNQFGFYLDAVEYGPPETVHLPNGKPLEMIAGDGAGGAYMLAGAATEPNRPVVYLDSEGSGGLIAPTLREALGMVVGFSSIHDATVRRLDDDGPWLYEHLVEADAELREEWPTLDEDRARAREALDLPTSEHLVELLQTCADDADYRPISDLGDVYEPMLE
jgi:hypothetical protein